jgi:rhodanese-related sulfurtransferase
MKKQILLLLVLISSGMISSAQTANSTVVTNLSAMRFKAITENDKKGQLLDLRTTEEIMDKGYIKGAVQLDFLAKDSEKQIDKLDKNKTYYIYCASGGRSADCSEYMEKHGFKRVYTLEKGFSDWVSKGYAVEKK